MKTTRRRRGQQAEMVKALADRGLLFAEIAREVGTHRTAVVRAWAYCHESCGLAVPDW